MTLWLHCRLLLGFGIGGEYPLSASVSSEGSSHASRGRAVGTTFAMQGVGNLMASLIMFILLKSSLPMDWVWRVALGAGASPPSLPTSLVEPRLLSCASRISRSHNTYCAALCLRLVTRCLHCCSPPSAFLCLSNSFT